MRCRRPAALSAAAFDPTHAAAVACPATAIAGPSLLTAALSTRAPTLQPAAPRPPTSLLRSAR